MFLVSSKKRLVAFCCQWESCRDIIFKSWTQAAAAFWSTSSFTDQERVVLPARWAQLARGELWAHPQPGPWKSQPAWGLIPAPGQVGQGTSGQAASPGASLLPGSEAARHLLASPAGPRFLGPASLEAERERTLLYPRQVKRGT